MKQIFVILGAIMVLGVNVSVDASIAHILKEIRSTPDPIPRPSNPTPTSESVLSPAHSVTPSPNTLPSKPIHPTHFPELQHPQPHLPSYFEPSPFDRPPAPKPQPDESNKGF